VIPAPCVDELLADAESTWLRARVTFFFAFLAAF
jgi:hypothetical protein